MHWLRCCFLLTAASTAGACAESDGQLRLPEPSYDAYVASVYPVVLRDCGTPDCHGTSVRFFQVFGPGRTRLSTATAPLDSATSDELTLSFGRARSMLASPDVLLLRKPLAVAAGGAGHEGDDVWGQAVYRTRAAPGYVALEAWVRGAGESP